MRSELDTKNPPGQQVNVPKEHLQLSDYIRSINRREALDNVASEKKLSFDEWYAYHYTWENANHKDFLRGVWEAAQKNVK